MVQVIQIKRKTTGAGVPATGLAPGELAYNTTGHVLMVGDGANTVQTLVGATRQLELGATTPAQEIIAPKTIAVGLLKLTGGLAGNVVQTDGAGNLSFVASPPPTPATAAEMALATRNDVFDTPLASLGLTGLPVAQLTTVEKTLVPAINGLQAKVDLIASGTLFVASFDAATGIVTWTPQSGQTGNALPTAAASNKGWYLIASAAGSTPPTNAPPGAYSIGDWLISNGATWTWLAYGGTPAVTANNVAVSPAVAGASDVQAALTAIDAALTANTAADALQDTAIAGMLPLVGGTMTGPINLLATAPTAPENATNKAYVDAENDAQDVIIATKIDAAAIAGKADKTYVDTQDLTKITKPAVAPAVALNIAVFADTTGSLAKDGGKTIAQIDTAIAAKADTTALANYLLLTGGTVTGAIQLPAAAPVAATEAANKKYVDDSIATLPGGGLTSVAVTAPLSGDGTVGNPIVFGGITVDAATFGGNGLTATPLTLTLVDGGVYT